MSKRPHFAALEQLSKSNYRDNEPWCLVSSAWWSKFKENESVCPPVDNSNLLSTSGLKPYLKEGKDYVLVPENAWDKVIAQYVKETLAKFRCPPLQCEQLTGLESVRVFCSGTNDALTTNVCG